MMILKFSFCSKIYLLLLIFQLFAASLANSQGHFGDSNFRKPLTKCWEIENGRVNGFASDNNSLILSSSDGNVFQINPSDGRQIWSNPIGNKFESIPYKFGEMTYVLSNSESEGNPSGRTSSVRLLDSLTGIAVWVQTIEQTTETKALMTDRSLVLIDRDIKLYALDKKDGKLNWNIDLEGKLVNYARAADILYILAGGNQIYKIDLNSGKVLAEKILRGQDISEIFSFEKNIIFADKKGTVFELTDLSRDARKIMRTGGEISSVKFFSNRMLIASNDNFLYLYSFEDRKVIWKKRLPGRISAEPEVFGESLFVSTQTDPEIILINLSDGDPFNRLKLKDGSFIRAFEVFENGLYILTGTGIEKFGFEKCTE